MILHVDAMLGLFMCMFLQINVARVLHRAAISVVSPFGSVSYHFNFSRKAVKSGNF